MLVKVFSLSALLVKRRKANATQALGTHEREFGVLEPLPGMGQASYLGLVRNSIRFGVMCLAYNLRRGLNIKKSCETSN